jgi:hypothetical protein
MNPKVKINLENYPLIYDWLCSGDSGARRAEFERLMGNIATKIKDRETDLPSIDSDVGTEKPS